MAKNNYSMIYRIRIKRLMSSAWWIPSKSKAIVGSLLFGACMILFFVPLSNRALSVDNPVDTIPDCSLSDDQHGVPFFVAYDVDPLFDDDFFYQASPPSVVSTYLADRPVTVSTTIDLEMQHRLIKLFKRYAPLLAAGVVLDPTTGAVLAMGNYAHNAEAHRLFPDADKNYCLYAGFPAASLIKIVTAAGVLEKKNFTHAMSLPVSGQYHTLYKHQLGLKRIRYRPERVSLEKAFSMSINPFFGKLGIDYLSRKEFAETAQALLFNVPLDFDLPLYQSSVFEPVTAFERAELASGFNTRTTISPLHAALIASLPANGGKIPRPFLIDHVVDEAGNDIYCAFPENLSQPVSSKSIENLSRLMRATIRYGTARKSFRHLRRLRGYKQWVLGGKTGAINLPGTQRRCEWFAGYAEKDEKKIAIALVMVHGELRTVKPSFVAAEMIKASLKQDSVKIAGQGKKRKKASPG